MEVKLSFLFWDLYNMDSKKEFKEPQPSTSSEEFYVSSPKVELPKGGGAISGIGEKFAANPVTGTGTMSVPIATSPGRAGFGPQLSLSYDSGSGNGIFGFGWSLSMPSITRKTAKGLPKYQDSEQSDTFILSGAEDLVPVLEKDQDGQWLPEIVAPRVIDNDTYRIQRYRPRIEGLFARIERWIRVSDGDSHWRSISKDNVLTLYGKDVNSRIVDPEDPTRIFSWLICETRDNKGNAVVYQYKQEDGTGVELSQVHERNRGERNDIRRRANRYLKRILYGNEKPLLIEGLRPTFAGNSIDNAQWMFEVVFDYGEHDAKAPKPNDNGLWAFRKDAFSTYRAGFEIRTTRLCQRVLMFHHFHGDNRLIGESYDGLARSTDFLYSHQKDEQDQDLTDLKLKRDPAAYTFLTAVSQCGYAPKVEQSEGEYLKRSLPPLEFEYSIPEVQDKVEEIDPASLENLPIGVDGANYQWTDLHGEGIPGILSEQANSWWYKSNVSPVNEQQVAFSPMQQVISRPNMPLASGAQLMDLEGNGQLDLVMLDGPAPGFYQHDKQQGWQSFTAFSSRVNRNFQDPNVKFIDLNGDGLADLLISEDNAFVWHASLAKSGFSPSQKVAQALDEETGPRLLFADSTQSIYIADFSGDGLTDLVRIRNGEICYWPNLGYCRFGAKVTMDNAPHFDHPDQFEHSRLRLTDIDGSGTMDLIYLHGDGVRLYFNQSGNSWSKAKKLKVFPRVDEIVSIAAIDLFANGTACLVWSSPLPGDTHHRMRYVKLMGKKKPHLLIKTSNNLGTETFIEYAPSTKFYLADKEAGKHWATKLPFPVHVVTKSTVKDKWRDTQFSTTYSYHHGYFDGIEREFRGFGRVEQVDIETYGKFAKGNASSLYITTNKTLYQPPVKSISWFHTGAALDRAHILSQFQQEYFVPAGFDENIFPDAEIPQGLTTDEWSQALRACKGLPLRQEVYELDVEALEQGEHKPVKLFSTAYHNCNIQMLQAQEDNRHAVFLVTEREAITYQYDLDLQAETPTPDPRISHSININIDELGNVIQAVAVVYPRLGKHQDDSLDTQTIQLIQEVQQETHIAYSENHFTNDINTADSYRLRVPCEALSYELTGITSADKYFTLKELQNFRLNLQYQTTGQVVTEIEYQQVVDRINPQKRIIEHSKILYFNDKDSTTAAFLKEPLPFNEQGNLGLPYETYTLALTENLLNAVLAEKHTALIKAELNDAAKSGYIKGTEIGATEDQYWIRSGIAGFADDAAEHFFLPEEYTDPFGNTSTLVFDPLDLFIESSIDVIGNSTSVEKFDYRVLAPRELKDINDNVSEVIFDVLGMPAAMAVKGKRQQGEWQGDNLDEFIANESLLNPLQNEVIGFCTNTTQDDAKARQWLANATTRFIYHFGETKDAQGKPIWGTHLSGACSITREQHKNQTSPLQITLECSDGGGNGLMQKTQAEPDPETGNPRWVINGLTVLNNKGNPVKQFEPAFSERFGCEMPQANGVTAISYYDAAGQVIRTELPDGSYSKVEYTPWHVSSYDPNDTAFDPVQGKHSDWYQRRTNSDHPRSSEFNSAEQQRAAALTEQHANTPTQVFLDSLGRDVISIEHNKYKNSNEGLIDEKYVTFTKLDAEGKPLWIRDDRGNLVMQYIFPPKANNTLDNTMPLNSVPCYDIAGNLLFQHSMDGGDRWMINDATGQPFYAWDKNENEAGIIEERIYHTLYDSLRRPIAQQLQINNNRHVIEGFVYGESQADSKTHNLRGQLFQHYDSSGLVSNEEYDFSGNLLEVKRQLISFSEDSKTDWTDIDAVSLNEIYTQVTEYDALNRMTRHENWHIAIREPAIYQPQYNQRGLLLSESLTVRGEVTEAIININYDAKGQRQFIEYGNGTVTRYDYDTETFRLKQLHTTKTNTGTPLSTPPSGLSNNNALQNFYYTYDPVGNITEIHDDAYEPVFFKNQHVEPRSRYTYDSLYRLVKAEGRESAQATVPTGGKLSTTQLKNFPIESFTTSDKTLRNYTQTYRYDSVGNIEQMKHAAGIGSWTRDYEYEEDSNRLKQTHQGSNTVNYLYDTHGSMLNFNNIPDEYRPHWDSNDIIHHINLGGGGDAFYDYGADKERSRKRIVKDTDTVIEERLYLGGMERYRRWKVNTVTNNKELVEEIETYHVFDGEQRVLIVEDVMLTDNSQNLEVGVLFRYQYGNHLGSVGLEVDEEGAIIFYEEYHPYGTTAFSAKNALIKSAKKRYRYTGMERDEESGLSYHSARYYLPWLGRWGSADPIGIGDGVNLFCYVKGSPVNKVDLFGMNGNSPSNSIDDVIDFEAREASFSAGKDHQSGKLKGGILKGGGRKKRNVQSKVIRKLQSLYAQLQKDPNNKKIKARIKKINTNSSSLQGNRAGDTLQENIRSRSAAAVKKSTKITHFGDSSQKLVPEVTLDGGKITKVDVHPGGQSKKSRTVDIGVTKDPIAPNDWDSLKGKRAKDMFEKTVDLKVSDSYVSDKKGFKAQSGGVSVKEARPWSKTKPIKSRATGKGGKYVKIATGLGVLLWTGDAEAAISAINPLANTTDALKNGDSVVMGLLKDVYAVTPMALAEGGSFSWEDDQYIYSRGDMINKSTGQFILRPGPKW